MLNDVMDGEGYYLFYLDSGQCWQRYQFITDVSLIQKHFADLMSLGSPLMVIHKPAYMPLAATRYSHDGLVDYITDLRRIRAL